MNSEAIRVGASDIHIEAFEKKLSVRLRVDGQLREIFCFGNLVGQTQ
jgi:general secretion pathway protein E